MRFEPNPDTNLLVSELLKLKRGKIMTYKTMSKLLSRPMKGADPALQSARRRAEREVGFVFSTIRTIGLVRLFDNEIVNLGESGAKKLRRSAKRSYKKITNVEDFDALPPVEQARHNGAIALFSGIMAASRSSTLKRLEKAADTGLISLDKTFALFSGKKG